MSTADLVGQLVTDFLLRVPLHRLADAHRARSHVYEFAWPSNVPGLGACHALEPGFVFDTTDVPETAKLAGPGAPRSLADEMHSAWVRFAVMGDPGRPAWDDTHPVRVFGAGGPEVERGPRDREMALWETGSPVPTGAERDPVSSEPGVTPRTAMRRLRGRGGVRRA
ncbi:carboxylesterase family protein [Streptomyces sp. NPDC087844]|uniref:carboxylesterase family protein n=1 Tax=Streptomyces sp. NPDC087844 TaxID=3365805 RepID=UPI0037FD14F7